jgi:transposase
VLGCAAGQSNTEVARRLGVHRNTVALWRGRFVEFRLDGLLDEATAVARIWRAFGLQPHRTETWKLSKDPLFVDKVRDVVGLYLNPPERQTHDYKRHGTSGLYAALDLSTGKVIGALHSRHRAIELKNFLQTIDREVPADLTVHLVLDNSSTHKTPAIKKWLLAHPRFELHFTPTSSSWMNLVERWFGELTSKKPRRADQILESISRYGTTIKDSGH